MFILRTSIPVSVLYSLEIVDHLSEVSSGSVLLNTENMTTYLNPFILLEKREVKKIGGILTLLQ